MFVGALCIDEKWSLSPGCTIAVVVERIGTINGHRLEVWLRKGVQSGSGGGLAVLLGVLVGQI